MRVVPWIVVVAFCLGLTGCSVFGRKASAPAAPANPPPPTPVGSLPSDRSVPVSGIGGVLAGQVVASLSRQPPPTYIQVTDLQATGAAAAPIEVAADSQGYFTIGGLQPGRHYQLVARARDGGRLLAGTVMAIPPNPKLLIQISEDFAGTGTPALPPVTTWPGPISSPGVGIGPPKPATSQDQTWVPGRDQAVNPKQPATAPPTTPPVAPVAVNPSQIADQNQIARNQLPAAIRSQVQPTWGPPEPKPRLPEPLAVRPDHAFPTTGPAKVPSCDLEGQLLHNFALTDLNGSPWEYRRERRGKLLLLDFWESNCVPCLYAVPNLNRWNRSYGPWGLEVIGIAYESGSPQDQVKKVRTVQRWKDINYRLLLGSDPSQCPVKVQFGVVAFPTLVLLDETGRIIWRSEGLGLKQQEELEIIIRQRLGVR